MSQNNKQEKKDPLLEDYLEDLRKLGVRDITHEMKGITKIWLKFPSGMDHYQPGQPEGKKGEKIMNGINQTLAWDNLEDRIIEKLRPLIENDADLIHLLNAGVILKDLLIRLITYDEFKQYCQETYGENEGESYLTQVSLAVKVLEKVSHALDEACGDDNVDSICLAEALMRKVNENE